MMLTCGTAHVFDGGSPVCRCGMIDHARTIATAPTRSGEAVLRTLTDEASLALTAGDVALVGRGTVSRPTWRPVTISVVRAGVAYDDSNPPQPYEVPVVEGQAPGEPPLVFSPADLLIPMIEPVPASPRCPVCSFLLSRHSVPCPPGALVPVDLALPALADVR